MKSRPDLQSEMAIQQTALLKRDVPPDPGALWSGHSRWAGPRPISHPSARAPRASTGDSPDPYHKQLLPTEWQTAPVEKLCAPGEACSVLQGSASESSPSNIPPESPIQTRFLFPFPQKLRKRQFRKESAIFLNAFLSIFLKPRTAILGIFVSG